MKKIIVGLFLALSFNSFSQDSTKVTINVQARDCEYIGSFAFNLNEVEEVYDSIKIKFRVEVPPTGITDVSITAYTVDWLKVFQMIKEDAVSIKANCTSRIETSLRAVNQIYLTGKLDAIDVSDTDMFQAKRQFGRAKLKRTL